MLKIAKNLIKKQQFKPAYQPQKYYSNGNSNYLNMRLKAEDILKLPSTPTISPSYPFGPYRFIDREYFIVSYKTDSEALKKVIPYPLEPNKEGIVLYEWINMPDSTGFGSYSESGTVIPCFFNGKEINYTLQMYLDCEPPIAAGREIWGFPKKYGEPKMATHRDTLVGSLNYEGQQVAYGTMAYKYNKIDETVAIKSLQKDACNLRIIPDVNGRPLICELVAYNLCNINLKEAWEGPARLELNSHVKAPTGRLPVREIIGGKHIKADISLPYGRVLHNYMEKKDQIPKSVYKQFKGTSFFKIDSFDKEEKVLLAPSMPHISPMYLNTKIQVKREILSFRYKTSPEIIAKNLPEPLVPHENPIVLLVFSDNNGTDGQYRKADLNIPCYLNNELVLYQLCSFVNQSSARTQSREEFGQPQKMGEPTIQVIKDTLLAKLEYGGQEVAVGSMAYKFEETSPNDFIEHLKLPIVQLKLIPSCEEGQVSIAQLTKMQYDDVQVHKVYKGPCELKLRNHVNAPIKDLPIVSMMKGYHIETEFTVRKAVVVHDYLQEKNAQSTL